MLFFENGSPNKDIHDALRAAERVRKALREEEAEKIANHAASVKRHPELPPLRHEELPPPSGS
jgi:hypothetical protein